MLNREEILEIEEKLSFIVNKWYFHLSQAIISIAKSSGVKKLYWNSSTTLSAVDINQKKKKYFYESLPKQLGFKEEYVDLRGNGEERLWCLNLGKKVHASDDLIELDRIPKNLQGAIIGILKSRGPYTKDQLRKAYNIIKKSRENKPKNVQNYSYDHSSTWAGGQKFTNKPEMIIKQRLDSNTINHLINEGSDTVKKFLSMIIDPSQHFEADVIGWGLVSKISDDIWVVNQIQTDTINKYLKLKKRFLNEESVSGNNILDRQSILDRLHANSRSEWVNFVDQNESLLNALREDPNKMYVLPNNDVILEHDGIQNVLKNDPELLNRIIQANSNKRINKLSFNLRSYRKNK